MLENIDNMQKYENYKEQMGRLKRALNSHFYLEAIFIEYAIMEDRLESGLRHAGRWNPKPDEFISLNRKVTLEKCQSRRKAWLRNIFLRNCWMIFFYGKRTVTG